MSRSGSIDSSVISCAITSLAEASSICTPRKMIRSSKSLLYGFISLIPYDVRSTKDGRMYLDSASPGSASPALPVLTLGSFPPALMRPALPSAPRSRCEPAVPVGVGLDLLDGLAGVHRGALGQGALEVEDLLGLDPDVGRRAADPAVRLVQHDLRVRHRVALARRARAEQELPHRRGHAHRVGGDVVRHV